HRPETRPWLDQRLEALGERLCFASTARERFVARMVIVLALLAVLGALGPLPENILWPVWLGFGGVLLTTVVRPYGRAARDWEPDPNPIAGRWGWQAWLVVVLAFLFPVTPTLMFWLQRPLFHTAATEIEATPF